MLIIDSTYDILSKNSIKHSTCNQLLETLNDWILFLESKFGVDFAKAFGTVSHVKFLTKLTGKGIRGHLLGWIGAFLSSRAKSLKLTNFYYFLHLLKVAYHKE